MNAARMADLCYRFIVWMRITQGIGAVLLLLGLVTKTPQLMIAGAVFVGVPFPLKRTAMSALARYANLAEYSGSVRNWSGLDHRNIRRNEDYTRIWLRNR